MSKLEARKLHPLSSSGDHMGRIYSYEGVDTWVYRLVRKERAQEVGAYLQNKTIRSLLGKSLIATKIEHDLEGPHGEMVLRHPKLTMVSYPYEWSALMLKEAGLMVGKLLQDLAAAGYRLSDPHAFNVTFVGGRPIYLDFGSLTQINSGKIDHPWLDCLAENYLLPTSINHHTNDGRWRSAFKIKGIQRLTYINFLSLSRTFPYESIKQCVRRLIQYRPGRKMEGLLADYLKALKSYNPSSGSTRWGQYYQEGTLSRLGRKEQNILLLCQNIKNCKQVCDVGGNTGRYLDLLKRKYPKAQTVLVDADEKAVDMAYNKHIYTETLVIPFEHLRQSALNPSFVERGTYDLTLFLAIFHHLMYSAGITLESFVATLVSFKSTYTIVEFIPPTDPKIKNWDIPQTQQITKEMFLTALEKYFIVKKQLPSYPQGRELLLLKKKVVV